MWKLPLPDASKALDELRTALTPSRGTAAVQLTDADTEKFVALYARYDAVGGDPVADLKADDISAAVAQAVYEGYDATQTGGRLAHLRDRLKVTVGRCPLCGFAPVASLDHYLPRSLYKSLAVYSSNLIPVCGTCNQKKSNIVGLPGQDEHFVHAYFTQLPNERFFEADCRMTDDGLVVTFCVVRTSAMTASTHTQLTFQFERLDLNSRLRSEASELLISLLASMELVYAGGGHREVAGFFHMSAISHQSSHGLNHWKTALFNGLTYCQGYCDGGFRAARTAESDFVGS